MAKLKESWSKLTSLQKMIFMGSGVAIIIAIILVFVLSSRPSYIPLLNKSLDQDTLDKVTAALDKEAIPYKISKDNKLLVANLKIKNKAQDILFRKELIPPGTDPWNIFDVEKWTLTDFEREVNYSRATQKQLKQYIESLDDIDVANVIINVPKKELFTQDREPSTVTASLTLKPSSDFATNIDKIKGVNEAIKHAVPGIVSEDNISILVNGIRVNDFKGRELSDELDKKSKLLQIKHDEEVKYRKQITDSLSKIFSPDRIQVTNVDLVMDYGDKKVETKEITPIVLQTKDPNDPTSTSQVIPNVATSEQSMSSDYKGTGVIPEGPTGFEDQVPPIYKDESGVVSSYNQKQNTTNYETNMKVTNEVGTPQIEKISIGVAISGSYKKVYDDKGKLVIKNGAIEREYTPVSVEDLAKAKSLIEASVSPSDIKLNQITTVSVQTIEFDRSEEHAKEDAAYFASQRRGLIILIATLSFIFLIALIIVINIINKQIEKRRIAEEERLARERIRQREAELAELENRGAQVEMSVEDRARIDLKESAMALARDNPENVANLIRTWILEE